MNSSQWLQLNTTPLTRTVKHFFLSFGFTETFVKIVIIIIMKSWSILQAKFFWGGEKIKIGICMEENVKREPEQVEEKRSSRVFGQTVIIWIE